MNIRSMVVQLADRIPLDERTLIAKPLNGVSLDRGSLYVRTFNVGPLDVAPLDVAPLDV